LLIFNDIKGILLINSNCIYNFQQTLLFSILPVLVLILSSSNAQAYGETQSLDEGWQYHWGDSSFNSDGIPEWTIKNSDQTGWKNIKFPSNPPNRHGQKNVWYRTTLPNNNWRDPVIYIFSVDLITEVYIDGRKIYQYGSFDKYGQGRFEGWPWHMISLPKDFAGKEIYFRVFSSATDIGLWGEVKLMERIDQILYILNNSLKDIVVSGLSLLISLLALIFAFFNTNRQTYLLIFFFTLASSVMLFAQSQAKQLLFNAPLVWDHIAATTYFVLPIVMALLFKSWYQWRFTKLIQAIWKFHALFLVTAITSSVAGFVELSSMYFVFDFLLTISLVILFMIAFIEYKVVEKDVKIMVFSFAVFSLFLLIDVGVAHNILPWTRIPIALGLLLFSLTLVVVSLHHFSAVQVELKELNMSLEQKVEDRTQELKRLAGIDSLTELMNRRAFYTESEHIFNSSKRHKHDMSVLVIDIDFFKVFNDSFGHAIGDEVIVALANCIKKVCREIDLAARFGGEEFVLLLEDTDKKGAMIFAERLRQAISEVEIQNVDKKVTASIGVSYLEQGTENINELIVRADKAMYIAKNNGRNNCQLG